MQQREKVARSDTYTMLKQNNLKKNNNERRKKPQSRSQNVWLLCTVQTKKKEKEKKNNSPDHDSKLIAPFGKRLSHVITLCSCSET
jgi:hypothetical protein